MTIGRPFIARVGVLYRIIINGRSPVPDRSPSYEAELPAPSMPKREQQSALSSVKRVKSAPAGAHLRAPARGGRLCYVNRGMAYVVEHTRSNLG